MGHYAAGEGAKSGFLISQTQPAPTKNSVRPETRPRTARPRGPLGPVLLTFVGSVIVLGGVAIIATLAPLAYSSGLGALGVFLQVMEGLGILDGVALLFAALGLWYRPDRQRILGVVIVTFALLSLFSGGGFGLGAFLAYLGGTLAILKDGKPAKSDWSEFDSDEDDPVIEADLAEANQPPSGVASPEPMSSAVGAAPIE